MAIVQERSEEEREIPESGNSGSGGRGDHREPGRRSWLQRQWLDLCEKDGGFSTSLRVPGAKTHTHKNMCTHMQTDTQKGTEMQAQARRHTRTHIHSGVVTSLSLQIPISTWWIVFTKLEVSTARLMQTISFCPWS